MIYIACVLKSGGRYGPEWVWALYRMVRTHLPIKYQFICLSDFLPSLLPGDHTVLKYDHVGWWSKLELFRPGLFTSQDTILYLDLDTLIIGDLTELAKHDLSFGMISDFYWWKKGKHLGQSGVMMFRPGLESQRIWSSWRVFGNTMNARGDGEWLREVFPDHQCIFERYPNQILSFKVHARHVMPTTGVIVCAHGVPKFDDVEAGWANKYWTRFATGD